MASIKKTAVAFGTILTFISQGTEGQTLASATAAASAHKLGKFIHTITQSFFTQSVLFCSSYSRYYQAERWQFFRDSPAYDRSRPNIGSTSFKSSC